MRIAPVALGSLFSVLGGMLLIVEFWPGLLPYEEDPSLAPRHGSIHYVQSAEHCLIIEGLLLPLIITLVAVRRRNGKQERKLGKRQ